MATLSEITARPLSGLNHIDALIGSGAPWNFIGRDTINYSFALGASGDSAGQVLNTATITSFSEVQATQVRAILAYISQVTGIRFAEVGSSAQADVHFGNADLHEDYTGQSMTQMGYTTQGGQVVGLKVDAWIYLDAHDFAYDNPSPGPGSIGYQTLLHELGHVLGLKHPFEGEQQLVAGDGLGQDNTNTTLMSYNDLGEPHDEFSPYDLAALAWLYGGDGLGGNYGVGAPGKVLVGSVENDLLQGGAGADTAVYAGTRAAHIVAKSDTGYTVAATSGSGGTDSLVGIERIQFSDKSINLTVGSAAASISTGQLDSLVELYIAYLDRTPDADGMAFWIDELKAGQSLAQIGQKFYDSGVHFGTYSAGSTNVEFVDRVYDNVLGRADPDAQGMAYWSNALASGSETRASLVASMLASAHTFKGRSDFGWVADLLDNKISVGKYVAIDSGLVFNTPQENISYGMALAAAVTPFSTTEAIGLVGVPDGLDLMA